MELSETGCMICLHKSKQQIGLLWQYFYPFSPAYLVIKIFFADFKQVQFFKKGLKRKKMQQISKIILPRLIHVFILKFPSNQWKQFRLQFFYRAWTMIWPVLFIEYAIKDIRCEKLFVVKSDHKLTFDQNVKSFGKKAKAKLKVLARVSPYIVLAKQNLQRNSFFTAQFNYFPLIWIVHSRFSNNQEKYWSTS